MCVHELTENVVCHSSTVEPKNPMTSPLHPAMRYDAKPSAHGPIQSCLSRKRSSGYRVKSLMASVSVLLYLSHRIQPTWLQKTPSRGVWGSPSRSVNLW